MPVDFKFIFRSVGSNVQIIFICNNLKTGRFFLNIFANIYQHFVVISDDSWSNKTNSDPPLAGDKFACLETNSD